MPHPKSIGRWCSKIDFSPGISLQVLNSIKKYISENAANEKKLQFGLQVDEMSIKNHVDWDGKKFHGYVDFGLDKEESDRATYMVLMLVVFNGHFKTPIII